MSGVAIFPGMTAGVRPEQWEFVKWEESMSKLAEISKALADLNEDETLKLIKESLKSKVAPEEILKACQEGMNEVGSRFEKKENISSPT